MPDLFVDVGCPSVRAVLMVAKAVGIDLNRKQVSLNKGEHMKPDFLKLNPCHAVPVLKDGDLVISESRAIMTYLVSRYAPDSPLYPPNPAQRAKIDMMLYFDACRLATAVQSFVDPTVRPALKGKVKPSVEHLKVVLDQMEHGFLNGQLFLVGDRLTLADLSASAYLVDVEVLGFDLGPYKNVSAWLGRVKAVPHFKDVHEQGHAIIKKMAAQ